MSRKRTGNYIIITAAALILATTALVSLLVYQRNARLRVQQSTYRILQDSAQAQAVTLIERLNGQYTLLESFAKLVSLDSYPVVDKLTEQLDTLASKSGFRNVAYVTPDGTYHRNDGQQTMVRDRHYFITAIQGQNAIEVISSRLETGQLRFMLAVPVIKHEHVVGLVVGTYDEQNFRALMTPQVYDSQSYAFVCNSAGTLVIGNDELMDDSLPHPGGSIFPAMRAAIYEDYSCNELIADLAAGRGGQAVYTINGERRYAVYEPLGTEDWMLFSVVSASTAESELETINRSGRLLTVVVMATAILTAGLVLWQQRRNTVILRLAEEEYRIAAKQSGKFLFSYDIRQDTLKSSESSIAEFGFEARLPNASDSLPDMLTIAPESEIVFLQFMASLTGVNSEGNCELKLKNIREEYRWYHADFTTVTDDNGHPRRSVISMYDCTRQREQLLAYQTWESAKAGLIAGSALYIEANVSADICERQEYSGIASVVTPDASFSEFAVLSAERLLHAEERAAYTSFMNRDRLLAASFSGNYEDLMECRLLDTRGVYLWYLCRVQLSRYPYTDEVKAFISFTDINARHMELHRLAEQASHDAMTKLYNRDATVHSVEQSLNRAEEGELFALFMVDLDGFKSVNDMLGHAQGDTVLVRVADTMASQFRAGDVVGRIGGDEFVAFLPGAGSAAIIECKAYSLCQALQFPIETEGVRIDISASVGAAVCSGPGHSFDELYRAADNCLYRAKELGKKRVVMTYLNADEDNG